MIPHHVSRENERTLRDFYIFSKFLPFILARRRRTARVGRIKWISLNINEYRFNCRFNN